MDARLKIIQFRHERGLTQKRLADLCGCTEAQIRLIEEGEVTHPKAAQRIAAACKLTELEAEELMPLNYRRHGGCYDPDMFKPLEPENPTAHLFAPTQSNYI